MTVSGAAVIALASQCAPNVAPQTVAAIVQTESRGRPLALNVNGGSQPPERANAAAAAATARRYIAAGYSVDLGLGQINSRNMRVLGLTWETVFDPCTNIAALGRLLTQNYNAAISGRDPQTALRVALSLYNTGSPLRGFRNGYVDRVVANAGVGDASAPIATSPAVLTNDGRSLSEVGQTPRPATQSPQPSPPPAWNLFERAAYELRSPPPPDHDRRTSVWTD